MTARHIMPFGAETGPEGTRFRLWAPAASAVTLLLDTGGTHTPHPMTAEADGWFQRLVPEALAGSLYRYSMDGGMAVPDPASRHQPQDVHGPSRVVDPAAYPWETPDWRGRPWAETVLMEVHVGTATPEGTFDALRQRLPHYRDLGITAVELMPLSDFPGDRNWGYDGVLPFAPDSRYGTPEDLKRLIDTAHGLGLQMFLDVVYNHFGPEGNYLHLSAPQFFTDAYDTPWGQAIDFTQPQVRDYVIHNVLFWLEEYRFDGLRFDAVHAIHDPSPEHILHAIAQRVHDHFRDSGRHVHLVLESDDNLTRFLGAAPNQHEAQWSDDWHHAAHVLLTGERDGYYQDYAADPLGALGRALAEGFVYQGEHSPFRDRPRGDSTARNRPVDFVAFLQNHDQIGNRALGERLSVLTPPEALYTLTVVLLLGPQVPLLFMGEEWNSQRPFLFFCDFEDPLAEQVREGRRAEFAHFPAFADPEARTRIPDPTDPNTVTATRLDWENRGTPAGQEWEAALQQLLAVRHAEIIPRLPRLQRGTVHRPDPAVLLVHWPLTPAENDDGAEDVTGLTLFLNASDQDVSGLTRPPGRLVGTSHPGADTVLRHEGRLPRWTALWLWTQAAA